MAMTKPYTLLFGLKRAGHYLSMRQILRDFGRKDEDELLKEGLLQYNTEYLESKLIFK